MAAKDATSLDLASRLAPAVDPQITSAVGQLGPWDTGYIAFGSGVAVNGNANLTLHRNGAFNFSGHFHVSGAISYNDSFAWAVRDFNTPATVYVFAHQGRLHGTFEAGSRDDDRGNRSSFPHWPRVGRLWSAAGRGGGRHVSTPTSECFSTASSGWSPPDRPLATSSRSSSDR